MNDAKKITKDLSFAMKKLVETKEYKDLMMGIKNIQSTFSAYSQSEEKKFTPVLNRVSQSEEYKKAVHSISEMDREFKEKINKHNIKFPSAYIKFPFQKIHEDPIELKNFEFHQLNFFAKGYNPVLMHEAKISSGKYLQVSISGDIDEEIRNEVRNLIKEIELRYKI